MSTGFILNKARENISVIILIMMPSVARVGKFFKNSNTIYMYICTNFKKINITVYKTHEPMTEYT
jgi:hypothetical protein